jgi:hypothetical protein
MKKPQRPRDPFYKNFNFALWMVIGLIVYLLFYSMRRPWP